MMASTPYEDFPTTELIQARTSLTALVERPDLPDDQRRAFNELLGWTVLELADRVTTLVELNAAPCFGAALESLAFDVGIRPTAPPRTRPNDSSLTTHRGSAVSEPFIVKQRARQTPAWFDVARDGKVVAR